MSEFNTEKTELVFDHVMHERILQHMKWGDQSAHTDLLWNAILVEEVGEAAQATLHNLFGGKATGTLREELVQVAAVAVAWIEALDARGEVMPDV